ncbi:MAG: hypothetical protein HWN66_21080 [Candidatus Helarchaeota archaeon]|nr:hypothetical protein [Candidatus Helarchaeota archaeon]
MNRARSFRSRQIYLSTLLQMRILTCTIPAETDSQALRGYSKIMLSMLAA